MLTEREKKLLVTPLVGAKLYSDAHPDVGMGPTYDMLLDDVVRIADVEVTDPERAEIIEAAKIEVEKPRFMDPPAGM